MTYVLGLTLFLEGTPLWYKVVFSVLFVALFAPTLIAFIFGAPWVPTPQAVVDTMLKVADIKKGERLIDPGCGDGRMVVKAAKQYGAQATGYELFFLVYIAAKIRNLFNGFPARIRFKDARTIDYSKVDIIVCYMLDTTLKKWRRIWESQLPQGARVISYAFKIDGWEPVQTIPKNPDKNYGPIRVYVIGKT